MPGAVGRRHIADPGSQDWLEPEQGTGFWVYSENPEEEPILLKLGEFHSTLSAGKTFPLGIVRRKLLEQ